MEAPLIEIENPRGEEAARRFHGATSVVDLSPAAPTAVHHGGKVLALPAMTEFAPAPLEACIALRRTRRSFDRRAALPLPLLARLLALSCGQTAAPHADGTSPMSGHRAVPSAGASYAVSVRVAARQVAGLAPAVYAYDASAHHLTDAAAMRPSSAWAAAALGQPWLGDAATLFALVGTLDRIAPRYASRGYRYMLFESGHIAQNLYLLATAHGLCAQATGGFFDATVNRLLGLDDAQDALYLVAIGPSSDCQRGQP